MLLVVCTAGRARESGVTLTVSSIHARAVMSQVLPHTLHRRQGLTLRPLWSERPRCVTRGSLRSWSADLSIFEVLLGPDIGDTRRRKRQDKSMRA